MNATSPPDDRSDLDHALDMAMRERRRRLLAQRAEPTDPASGTALVAARLARARAEARSRPRTDGDVIDLT